MALNTSMAAAPDADLGGHGQGDDDERHPMTEWLGALPEETSDWGPMAPWPPANPRQPIRRPARSETVASATPTLPSDLVVASEPERTAGPAPTEPPQLDPSWPTPEGRAVARCPGAWQRWSLGVPR